jgi:hypothetical protein
MLNSLDGCAGDDLLTQQIGLRKYSIAQAPGRAKTAPSKSADD